LGNRFITGGFEGIVDFDPNNVHAGDTDIVNAGIGSDVFVAKYDPAGALLWSRRMGNPTDDSYADSGFSLAADGAGNVYVAGMFGGTADFGDETMTSVGAADVFLVKLDGSGQVAWATSYDGSMRSIACGVDGDVYLSVSSAGGGANDVLRYNADDGSAMWKRTLLNGNQKAMVAADDDGNVYIADHFFKTFDVDPGPGVHIISPQASGLDIPNKPATFVLKLNGAGEFVWARVIQSRETETTGTWSIPASMVIDGSGSIVVAGGFGGLVDFDPSATGFVQLPGNSGNKFLFKLDGDGNHLWARALEIEKGESLGNVVIKDLAVDKADNVYVGGYLYGYAVDLDPSDGTFLVTPTNHHDTYFVDSFLSNLTADGEFRWATSLGTLGGDVALNSVDVTATNELQLTGRFLGSVDFDPSAGTHLLNTAANSGWLLTLNPIPAVTISRTQGLATFEAGATAGLDISLDAPPTADVVIAIASSDTTEGVPSAFSLTFTPANWNVPQTVQVMGVDDAVVDGDVAYNITLTAASADVRYNGLSAPSVSVTNLDDDVLPTKFYVVNDATQNLTYEYDAAGGLVESYSLNSGNSAPRGAASTVAGDKTWVVDANRKVYVYDNQGALLGSWTAGTLASNATVEGIATNGTDVWIVDARSDKVYKYTGAATRLSGSQSAASSFKLNSSNTSPKDIVTDGTSLWVVNDSTTDKVFKYSTSGALAGSWTISSGGGRPTGITLDPSNATQDLWIVDSSTDKVYQYSAVRARTSGSQAAASTFTLATGNTNPQGIADPPAAGSLLVTESPVPSAEAAISGNDAALENMYYEPLKKIRIDTARRSESRAVESHTSDLSYTVGASANLLTNDSRVANDKHHTEVDDLFAQWESDPLELVSLSDLEM